jgi:hypothetical protein
MGLYAVVDYDLTLSLSLSQLQHIYHGQPYMPESTLTLCHGVDLGDLGFGHWIRTQRAVVASRRATNLASHFPQNLATHIPTKPPISLYKPFLNLMKTVPLKLALPESLVPEDCGTLVSGHMMLLLEHVRRLLHVLTT